MNKAIIPEAVQQLILGGSVFAIGVMLYLGLDRNLRSAIELGDWLPIIRDTVSDQPKRIRWWRIFVPRYVLAPSIRQLGYASARVGTAMLLLLITELIFRAPNIPLDVRSVLYLVGLIFATGGYFVVAISEEDE